MWMMRVVLWLREEGSRLGSIHGGVGGFEWMASAGSRRTRFTGKMFGDLVIRE
jgi:hypothetical protein